MKEHITQLTMSEYVNLICGDISVLLDKKTEMLSPKKLERAKVQIVYEFRELSDPTGMQSYLIEYEDRTKLDASITIYRMCQNLIEIKAYDGVREVLGVLGLRASTMSNDQVKREVSANLKRAESLRKKLDEERQDNDQKEMTEHDLRVMFDRQATQLMTYFKFQIDLNTIKASVFASMIDQANREIKAKMSILKK